MDVEKYKKEPIYLEEEEDEEPPDPFIIQKQLDNLEKIKNKDNSYKEEFDKAQKAKKDWEEAQEEYENGKTEDNLEKAKA